MLVLDYDASDDAPVNKTQFLTMQGAVSAVSWEDVMYHMRPAQARLERFTRVGGIPSGTDIKLYDIGNFNFAIQGQASTDMIGELYVSYDVDLSIPTGENACASGKVTSGGTVSKTAVFGDAATYSGPVPVSASGSTLTFNQPGEFLVSIQFDGTGTTNPGISGGTATVGALSNSVNSTSVKTLISFRVRAQRDETVVIDASGFTTVSASATYIASASYSGLS